MAMHESSGVSPDPQPPAPVGGGGESTPGSSRLQQWLLLALAAACTIGALLQEPPAADDRAQGFWQLLLRPIVVNERQLLPRVDSNLNGVCASSDGKRIWAVGDGGLLLYSADGGRSWQRQQVGGASVGQPGKRAAATAALAELLVPTAQADVAAPSKQDVRPSPDSSPGTSNQTNAPSDLQGSSSGTATDAATNPAVQTAVPRLNGRAPLAKPGATAGGSTNGAPASNAAPSPQAAAPGKAPKPSKSKKPISNGATAQARAQSVEPLPPARQLPDPATANLYAVACADDGRVWAAGEGGTILFSQHGTDWSVALQPWGTDLYALSPAGDRNGWAAGANGTVVGTTDGGRHWPAIQKIASTSQAGVSFYAADALGRVVAGSDSYLVAGSHGQAEFGWIGPGGSPAQIKWPVLDPDQLNIQALAAAPGGNAFFAIADNGLLFASPVVSGLPSPPMQDWRNLSPALPHIIPSGPRSLGASAPSGSQNVTLWAVGRAGSFSRLLVTPVGAGSYQYDDKKVDTADLNHIHVVDDRHAWIAGDGGTLLSTADGGDTWPAHTRHNNAALGLLSGLGPLCLPAPWWFLSLLLIGLLSLWRARVWSRTPLRIIQGAAGRFVSDRPLCMADPDAAHMAALANGLTDFLRNRATVPPLTIAVTGPWGSGKSSLMNLTSELLKSHGLYPVWFNAWHHQKGEQLLASIYANILSQAVPPWFSWAGLSFRWDLLVNRAMRRLLVSALVLLAAGIIGYLLIVRGGEVWTLLQSLGAPAAAKPGPAEGVDDGIIGILTRLGLLSGLAATPVLALWRALRAFNVSPGELMTSVAGKLKQSDLERQPAARYRFSQEFGEVAEALKPYRLVIFIDDLDRCSKDNVVEVLEAVNFLIVSGDCFVVLGLETTMVEASVKLAYQEIAKAMEDSPGSESDFARRYLEKLLNIVVRLPDLSLGTARDILEQPVQTPPPPKPATFPARVGRLLRGTPALLRPLTPVMLGVGLLALGMLAGSLMPHLKQPPAAATTTATAGGSPAAAATPGGQVSAAPAPAAVAEASRQHREAQFLDAPAANLSWQAGVLLLLLLMILIPWWRHRRQVVVRDSQRFTEALRIWHPWITFNRPTPRALKRFINRARFVAMQERGGSAYDEDTADSTAAGEREAAVVALCAVYEASGGTVPPLTDLSAWIEEALKRLAPDQKPGAPDSAAMQACLKEHALRIGTQVLKDHEFLARVAQMVEGLKVR